MKPRDRIVNSLLALLLLLVFAAIFALPMVLVVEALAYADRRLWPHIADRLARFGPPQKIVDAALLCLLALAAAGLFLKKRYWPRK